METTWYTVEKQVIGGSIPMKKLRSCTISRGTQICETKSWLARQKSAGILDVFQTFLTQPTAILAAKLCAETIGTASKA